MLFGHTQAQQSQLNSNLLLMDDYEGSARRQAEVQEIHAHVHEYGVITLKNSIEADKHAQVHVCWSMYGDLNPFITGTWHVSACLESLQPGNPQRIPLTLDTAIPLTPRHGPVDYETWVKIPAHTVTFTEDARPKSYRLVVDVDYAAPSFPAVPPNSGVEALTIQPHFVLVTPLIYRAPTGLPGPLTDVVDGPELQFYIVM
jgi:hypothetical protein